MLYHQNRDPEVASEIFEETQKELEEERESARNKTDKFVDWVCGIKGSKFPFFKNIKDVKKPLESN